ncbi:hypothetical protein phiLdb_00025 [Lactobacillus phage phiLdb]|uniref:Uncharacterized protein n=1 Tax=Lactobacillus phage phiLdb TaxID=1399942 RepID=U3PBH9_9CAUD|nr:hypothetical protein phiLdb_00025 [Lactobacillus phage phiLdb]AGW43702.1 hypothetical protein phiLdb_00025 [Lactobacillus phage phiLdb]
MSKKENNTLAMILIVVGIVMLLAMDSSSFLALVIVKIVGFLFAVSGVFMMEDKENE